MNKIKDFTDAELEYYGQIYAKLILNQTDSEILLDKEELEKRYFYKNTYVLSEYVEKIKDANYKADGSGFLELFRDDEKYKQELLAYKMKHKETIDKLTQCASCKCSTCLQICKYEICKNCLSNMRTAACEQDKYYIKTSENIVTLYSEDEQREVHFRVKGILYDSNTNEDYIYLIETTDPDNQHILQYVKNINGIVDYVSISEEELDRIYELFVEANCYE